MVKKAKKEEKPSKQAEPAVEEQPPVIVDPQHPTISWVRGCPMICWILRCPHYKKCWGTAMLRQPAAT